MVEAIIVLLIVAGIIWAIKVAPRSKPKADNTFTREDIDAVSITTLSGSDLRHNQSWKKDQFQSVIAALHHEGEGIAITRFGQVGAGDRFTAGRTLLVPKTMRFEVKAKTYSNLERKYVREKRIFRYK